MIRVIIVDDKRIVGSVYENPDESIRLAWAQENEKNCGHCVFTKQGEILEIEDKAEISELLVRSALNHLDLQGIKIGFTKNASLFDCLKKLGFRENEGKYEVNIADFFKPCCCK